MEIDRGEGKNVGLVENDRRCGRLSRSHNHQTIGVLAFLAAMAVSVTASAVDGCEVLLCLAAPNGWRNISQCVPPIEEFLRDQALGRAFPHCSMAGNPQTRTGSYAAPMPSNYYNQCPAGTSALPLGSYAIMSAAWVPSENNAAWARQQALYAGIGDGSTLTPSSGLPTTSLPPVVCVAGAPIGEVILRIGGIAGTFGPRSVGPGAGSMVVPVYSSITILQPESGRNVIGVWIDGTLYNQVHW
jgi:hypothetical protein